MLDYGCGPGNDLVGFGVYSKPARLIGMDVSVSSLDEAKHRLALHGIEAELHKIDVGMARVPLDDARWTTFIPPASSITCRSRYRCCGSFIGC